MNKISCFFAVIFSSLLVCHSVYSDSLLLPNLNKNATGTSSAGKYLLDVNIAAGTVTATNPSVGLLGVAIPTSGSLIAGEDGSGNLQPFAIDGSGNLKVNIAAGAVVNPANGTVGSAAPTVAGQIGFRDGSGNLQFAKVNGSNAQLVDGSGVTQPISAASLPLPTGASTAAKQPALGTAGTASTDVITVQGIASMTPIATSVASLPLPTGAATEATLSALNAKVTAVNTGAVVVSSSALPTGAATEATLAAASAKLPATLGQHAMAASMSVAIASDQSTVPVSGTVTANIGTSGSLALDASVTGLQVSQGSTTSGQKGGLVLGAVTTAAPSYTTAQSSPLSLTTAGALRTDASATTQPVSVGGVPAADKARNDYTSTNVTTSAYVQLIASTANTANSIEIFDSSGQTLFLATGAAASEVNQVYIIPGGNGRIPLKIAAGTRISIKAVSATANTGEIDINLYQ